MIRSTLAAILYFAMITPAMAQDPEWTSQCAESNDACTLSRSVQDTATGTRAGTILANVTAGAETMIFGAVVPLGVAVQPGIRVLVGEDVIELPITVCYPDGCRGLVEVDAATQSRLLDVENVEIRYLTSNGDRQISVPVPMSGLSAAIAEIRNRAE